MAPRSERSTAPFFDSAGNVVVRGTAALADGTPIPIDRLDSGERC